MIAALAETKNLQRGKQQQNRDTSFIHRLLFTRIPTFTKIEFFVEVILHIFVQDTETSQLKTTKIFCKNI